MVSRRHLLRTALAGGLIGVASPRARASAAIAQGVPSRATPAPLALTLARFLNPIQIGDLPQVAVEHAKMVVASTLASAAPGSLIGSTRIARQLAKEHGGRPEATVWYDGAKLPVHETARVNAMLSDASASDDSDLRNVAHTGTTVTATSLAVAERTRATGADVLSAIVAGYEAAGRIGEAIAGSRQGFHASVLVAFGGAVAAAKLMKLSDDQMAHAIALTATSMGGLSIGTNSWAREYHAGNAAMCGVNAALAAGRGFTVNEDMLEAPRGFLAVFGGGKADAAVVTRDLGREWDIVTHLAIKLVPGAHAFHPAAEAAGLAAREANVTPDRIAAILVSGPQIATMTGTAPPEDLIEAIHSLPYFVASAVVDREFGWTHATEEKIHNPAVARLMALVQRDGSPPPVEYQWGWGATVTLVTATGARFTSTVDAPRASGPRGIMWGDVDAKYRALTPQAGLPEKRIEQTLEIIHGLERLTSVSELTTLLR